MAYPRIRHFVHRHSNRIKHSEKLLRFIERRIDEMLCSETRFLYETATLDDRLSSMAVTEEPHGLAEVDGPFFLTPEPGASLPIGIFEKMEYWTRVRGPNRFQVYESRQLAVSGQSLGRLRVSSDVPGAVIVGRPIDESKLYGLMKLGVHAATLNQVKDIKDIREIRG